MDVSGLADSVAAVLRLGVHGGVPVAVVEHHCVGSRQVHAYTSAASWQNEAENTSICIEALHEGLKEKQEDAQKTNIKYSAVIWRRQLKIYFHAWLFEKTVNADLSLLHTRAAIQTEVDVSVVVEELLQHVQHARHLSEDQHSVASCLQLTQQSVESLQLTCTHGEYRWFISPTAENINQAEHIMRYGTHYISY